MNRVWQVTDEQVQESWAAWSGPKRGAVKALAIQLGVPRDWLSRRLSALGLAAPHQREPNWTPAEDALLATLPLYNPARAARIMREHGFNRTATAIVLRAKRLEISRRATHETLSANQAAEILGFDSKTVGGYCEAGIIVAERMADDRTAQQGGHRWCIAPDALRAFIRSNINAIDLRRVDKLAYFTLVDQVTVAPAAAPQRDPVKGWTPEKRKRAYRRFGEIIIQVADELNVPANELLAYALKGEVPPEGRDEGFEDTKVPGQAALPSPAPQPPAPASGRGIHHWTDAELEELKQRAGKEPAEQIAAALGRSVQSLYRKVGEQGISLRSVVWNDELVGKLRSLAGTMPKRDVAIQMGMSLKAVEKAASRQQISLKFQRQAGAASTRKPVDSYWTSERLAELRRLAEVEKLSARQIAEVMSKTPGSISGACYRFKIRLQAKSGARLPRPADPKVPLAKRMESRPLRPAPKPVARPPAPTVVNPRAPSIAPSATAWIRLRHPDGRWLSMDGLGWVEEKAHSYFIPFTKLAAARNAFPLAAECIVVPEEAWKPRDIAFAGAIR